MYDKGLLSATQLKKIGLTPKAVGKLKPTSKKKSRGAWDTIF
jgi:hypothetical protein